MAGDEVLPTAVCALETRPHVPKSRCRRLLISSSNDLMPSIGIVQTRYDAAEHRRLATCDMERWRFIPDRDQA